MSHLRTGMTVLCLLALATTAMAQSTPRGFQGEQILGIGYVANPPSLLLGASGIAVSSRGFGLYVDAKFATDNPEGWTRYNPNLTRSEAIASFPDQNLRQHTHWRSFNAALVHTFSDELLLYAGGGLSSERVYTEFYDDTQERGELGFYVVTDEERTGDRVNALGGAMLRLTPRIMAQVGGELQPVGMMFGLIFRF
ncbi:MAG TPA: hypothetical protein VK929_16840 [Longimicrobiales bacterium]|nr:hypothetical protein [Longimicrobiales bacterium]